MGIKIKNRFTQRTLH